MDAGRDDHLGRPPETRPNSRHEEERRKARRARAVRSRRRRQGAVGVLLAAAVIVVVVLLVSSGSRGGGSHALAPSSSRRTPARASGAHPASAQAARVVAKPPARPHASHHAPARSPGSLPQTQAFPSAHTTLFHSLMASLWAAITTNSPPMALRAFFPKAAYVQLKAIAGAESDWSNRLVRDYGLDIAAAHALLGSSPRSAQLVRVQVPSSYGHWVPPGVCDNSIGYYEVPNARMVYRAQGAERSFGIASMISWRGVWYVVHLGAILRPAKAAWSTNRRRVQANRPIRGPAEARAATDSARRPA